MYSIFVCVCRKPQTTHSFICGCPFTVVKDVLLPIFQKLQEKLAPLLSCSLFSLKIWKQETGTKSPMRWHQFIPGCLCVCGYVWVCAYVNQPFHSASSPAQQKHPHSVLSQIQKPTNIVSLDIGTGRGWGSSIVAHESIPLAEKKPMPTCSNGSPVTFSLQHLVDMKSIVRFFDLFYSSVVRCWWVLNNWGI